MPALIFSLCYYLLLFMNDFEQSISALDLRLFEKISSQSSDGDKGSLLAIQLATRELRPNYKYLEIGSYLGGSLQPYLLDDRCERIYSIDKRPASQPDERKIEYRYLNNSTERMMENLRGVSEERLAKIVTIDGDTREIGPESVPDKIDVCFIDGEHTDAAVMADFQFCLDKLNAAGGVILFHDSQIIYNGLARCIEHLKTIGKDFRAYILPHVVFVIEIGDFPLHRHPQIAKRLINNHEAYLFSLQDNDYYREFTNKMPFRLVRNFMSRMKKGNVSQ